MLARRVTAALQSQLLHLGKSKSKTIWSDSNLLNMTTVRSSINPVGRGESLPITCLVIVGPVLFLPNLTQQYLQCPYVIGQSGFHGGGANGVV